MNLAWVSIAALVVAVVLSCVTTINVGLLSLALAMVIGVFLGGMTLSAVTADFPVPLFITLVSQVALPLGLCVYLQATDQLQATGIWLAIVLGHFTRCVLTVVRFRQGKWRSIVVAH